jgi:hypothetical protein
LLRIASKVVALEIFDTIADIRGLGAKSEMTFPNLGQSLRTADEEVCRLLTRDGK